MAVPRIARFLCAGLPHHVTQRGNRRGQVFFSDADHQTYLALLREYSVRHEVAVLAYCLMPNHVHLVLVPAAIDSLPLSLGPMHLRYAQRLNRMKSWKGHVWQGRYFASVLDEQHCWAAIRYVERNPVRAGLVRRAERYLWSSASAHCGLSKDPVLTIESGWRKRMEGIGDWCAWLREGEDAQMLDTLRKNSSKDLPCGSDEFIDKLEQASGRRLRAGRRNKGSRLL